MSDLKKIERKRLDDLEQKRDSQFNCLMTFSHDKEIYGLKNKFSKLKRNQLTGGTKEKNVKYNNSELK